MENYGKTLKKKKKNEWMNGEGWKKKSANPVFVQRK